MKVIYKNLITWNYKFVDSFESREREALSTLELPMEQQSSIIVMVKV